MFTKIRVDHLTTVVLTRFRMEVAKCGPGWLASAVVINDHFAERLLSHSLPHHCVLRADIVRVLAVAKQHNLESHTNRVQIRCEKPHPSVPVQSDRDDFQVNRSIFQMPRQNQDFRGKTADRVTVGEYCADKAADAYDLSPIYVVLARKIDQRRRDILIRPQGDNEGIVPCGRCQRFGTEQRKVCLGVLV